MRLVSGTASRTFLRCVGRVDLLYLHPKLFRFVGDEQADLIEAPTVFHTVVFAGFRPTTFACRGLAYPCKRFYFDRAYALGVRMVHDLSGKLMVDISHPPRLFALALFDSAGFLCFLELLASAVEAAAHEALISSIAKEACALVSDMSHSRDFDPKINTHDGLPIRSWSMLYRQGDICYPLAPLLFETQYSCFPFHCHINTADTYLLRFPVSANRKHKHSILNAPVLIVPLTDGLFEERETAKLKRTFEDRLSIPQDLIFDSAGKVCPEIFGADFPFQDSTIESRNQNIDRADIFLAVSHEQLSLFRRWIQTEL
jgi:hypothetical protein